MNILSFSTISILLVIISAVIFGFYKNKIRQKKSDIPSFFYFIFEVVKNPFVVFSICYLSYSVFLYLMPHFPNFLQEKHRIFADNVMNALDVALFSWLLLNLLVLGKCYLLELAIKKNHTTTAAILPAISNSILAAIILLMLNLLIPQLGLTGISPLILTKMTKVLFIGTLGWIFIQLVNSLETYILTQYFISENDIIASRKLKTQVVILKRIILAICLIVIFASILMVFDSVRNIGAGILTTAGILSAVTAFASQQSLSRLFSGLQLAFTQPIRIGDTVIIDNEFGEVEEINLSYVVIKLWDFRRLIKPTDYFTSHGVQNLTRESSQLLGTIFIYTDYTLPVDKVRETFFKFLEESSSWDKKVKSLEVTDITEKSMQIRALMSADNAKLLWSLRCEIRERLMKYLVATYPECFSKSRSVNTSSVDGIKLAEENS